MKVVYKRIRGWLLMKVDGDTGKDFKGFCS